jgi:hypothetical protein
MDAPAYPSFCPPPLQNSRPPVQGCRFHVGSQPAGRLLGNDILQFPGKLPASSFLDFALILFWPSCPPAKCGVYVSTCQIALFFAFFACSTTSDTPASAWLTPCGPQRPVPRRFCPRPAFRRTARQWREYVRPLAAPPRPDISRRWLCQSNRGRLHVARYVRPQMAIHATSARHSAKAAQRLCL